MDGARPRRLELEVRGPRVGIGYAVGVAGTLLAVAALLPFRASLATTDVALVFLLVVMAAAATGGLGPGVTAAALGFLAADVLFTRPYYTLFAAKSQDYRSLAVYLVVALVVSALVGVAEQRRAVAEQRERETHTLYELSSALVAHGNLTETLARVPAIVRGLLGLAGCAIVLGDEEEGVRVLARDGELPADLAKRVRPVVAGDGDGGDPAAAVRGELLVIPMRVSSATVGALAVAARPGGLGLGAAEQRVLAGFAAQAALAVEQARKDEAWARAQALEATDRLRRALLNSVSHDLRTPIASILASASSLLDPKVRLDEQERRQFLATIEEHARRLARLVHNLLDLSRIEAGAVDPYLTEVWLPEVVEPAVQRLREALPPARAVTVDVPESLPPVLVDPVRLEQVLGNLLDNARRYGGDGPIQVLGRVVDGSGGEGAVELRVVDHGPGIPERERERVFTQFYRLDRLDGRGEGTGLGLAICRGLVEAMGGRIWVETAPGGGAALVVRLPRADLSRAGGSPQPAAREVRA